MSETGASAQPEFRRDPRMIMHPDIEGPMLTDDMVGNAEQILGVKLPDSYVALMWRCNGGCYLAPLGFRTTRPTSWARDHVPVTSIFGIGESTGEEALDPPGRGLGILATPYLTKEWGLPAGLVLLDGDGHTWIALDYRSTGPEGQPSVIWLDLEVHDELEPAPTFDEFLRGLRTEDGFAEDA